MQMPMRMARKPVRVKIGSKQRGLKKDEAGDPDRGRSAKKREQLLGRDGLDEKQQERGEEDCGAEKQA